MSLCEGVTFSSICREWRGKWSEDADKASLVAVNKLFNETFLPTIKSLEGFEKVQRIVCGDCHDWKFVIQFKSENYPETVAGEEPFLAAAGAIEGITSIETQTYTIDEL
jgi:hypothetical protein